MKHSGEPGLDLLVPHSQHPKPLLLEKRLSASISFRVLQVYIPIDFYDEARLRRVEVDDKRTNGMLTAKLDPVQATMAQFPPKGPLGWCGNFP